MRLFHVFFAIFFLIIFVSGCASFKKQSVFVNRNTQYLAANNLPPLKIPPGVASGAFHSYYPVSTRFYPEANQPISLVPPGL